MGQATHIDPLIVQFDVPQVSEPFFNRSVRAKPKDGLSSEASFDSPQAKPAVKLSVKKTLLRCDFGLKALACPDARG
jgi:hypothetical protein